MPRQNISSHVDNMMPELMRRMRNVKQMDWSQLAGMVKSVLGVWSCMVDIKDQERVYAMQGMALELLEQMSRTTTDWKDREQELKIINLLVREVEGVPGMVARKVEELLGMHVTGMSAGIIFRGSWWVPPEEVDRIRVTAGGRRRWVPPPEEVDRIRGTVGGRRRGS